MLLLYCGHVGSLPYSQDQLGLPTIHGGIEAPRVHSKRVDELTLSDIPIHSKASLDGYMIRNVLSPTAMSPIPKFINRHN